MHYANAQCELATATKKKSKVRWVLWLPWNKWNEDGGVNTATCVVNCNYNCTWVCSLTTCEQNDVAVLMASKRMLSRNVLYFKLRNNFPDKCIFWGPSKWIIASQWWIVHWCPLLTPSLIKLHPPRRIFFETDFKEIIKHHYNCYVTIWAATYPTQPQLQWSQLPHNDPVKYGLLGSYLSDLPYTAKLQ